MQKAHPPNGVPHCSVLKVVDFSDSDIFMREIGCLLAPILFLVSPVAVIVYPNMFWRELCSSDYPVCLGGGESSLQLNN